MFMVQFRSICYKCVQMRTESPLYVYPSGNTKWLKLLRSVICFPLLLNKKRLSKVPQKRNASLFVASDKNFKRKDTKKNEKKLCISSKRDIPSALIRILKTQTAAARKQRENKKWSNNKCFYLYKIKTTSEKWRHLFPGVTGILGSRLVDSNLPDSRPSSQCFLSSPTRNNKQKRANINTKFTVECVKNKLKEQMKKETFVLSDVSLRVLNEVHGDGGCFPARMEWASDDDGHYWRHRILCSRQRPGCLPRTVRDKGEGKLHDRELAGELKCQE